MPSTPTPNPSSPPRASTIATRSLLSGSAPSPPPPTTHYEAAAVHATQHHAQPATTASSAAASVSSPAGPAAPLRQQSWKMSDFKGQQQAQMVDARAGGQGYSTAG